MNCELHEEKMRKKECIYCHSGMVQIIETNKFETYDLIGYKPCGICEGKSYVWECNTCHFLELFPDEPTIKNAKPKYKFK